MDDQKFEDTRAAFEGAVYAKYFDNRGKERWRGEVLSLHPDRTFRESLLGRLPTGEYERPSIDAMWFGWRMNEEASSGDPLEDVAALIGSGATLQEIVDYITAARR